MKLLTRTSLYYIAAMGIVLAVGGCVFFLVFRSLVDEELTEGLYRTKRQAEAYVAATPNPSPGISGNEVEIRPCTGFCAGETVSDTSIFDQDEQEFLPYRQIRFKATGIDGQSLLITIRKTAFESDDLVETTGLLLLILTAGILTVFILINALLSRRLWRPFYHSLTQLANYRNPQDSLSLPAQTGTMEFDALKAALTGMNKLITSEYTRLKEFSENAAHELQTPLL